jgi:hypothetical protein
MNVTEMVFFEGATRVELAEWLMPRDARDRAMHEARQARAIFERLKARPWLDRVRKLEAS